MKTPERERRDGIGTDPYMRNTFDKYGYASVPRRFRRAVAIFLWDYIKPWAKLLLKIVLFGLFLHVMTYIGPYLWWLVSLIISFLLKLFEPLLP
jgi:hypothetical protein